MATRYVWNKHHRDSYTYYTEDMRSIQSGFSVSSAKGSSYGEIVYYSQKKLDPSTGEFSLTGRNTAIGMATGYAKYNNGCIYADFEYTHNDTVIAADNVISYTAKANTGYEKGSLIGPVSNAGSSAYPSNNYSGDYWYQSQGNDVIDPDDVSIPSDILGGNTIEITLTPSTGKVYGGTVSYTYQYRLDGGEWQTLATTTETTQQLLVPAGTNTIEVQVRAQDDIGFTSPTWVASSMEHVTNNQPPTAPGSIQVTNVTTGQEAAVTLTAATDPDGTVESYIYERSVDGGAFQPFANVNALTQTDHISGDWGTVAYRACAVDDDGAAGPYVTSETKTVTTGLVTIAGPAADLGERPGPFPFWFCCGVSDQTAVQDIAVRVTVDGKDFFTGTLDSGAAKGLYIDTRFRAAGQHTIAVTASKEDYQPAAASYTFTVPSVTLPYEGRAEMPQNSAGQPVWWYGLARFIFGPDGKDLITLMQEMQAASPKMVTGSYQGTGQSGSRNPNTLAAGFRPRVVLLSSGYSIDIMIVATESGSTGTVEAVNYTLSDTGVSWYASSAAAQGNESGKTYRYVMFG